MGGEQKAGGGSDEDDERQSGGVGVPASFVTCGGTAWNSIRRPVESITTETMPETAIGGSVDLTRASCRGTSMRGLIRYHIVTADGLPAFKMSQRVGV